MKFFDSVDSVKPVGHYSTAVVLPNGFVFISGQISIDEFGNLTGNTLRDQAKNIFNNVKKILSELGYSIENIFKVVVYITDIGKFSEFNEIYKEFFGNHKPVRTTVEVSKLPKGALVEIEVSAFK
ncbi:MAG: RidA family protein [Brevinematia bacterium]